MKNTLATTAAALENDGTGPDILAFSSVLSQDYADSNKKLTINKRSHLLNTSGRLTLKQDADLKGQINNTRNTNQGEYHEQNSGIYNTTTLMKYPRGKSLIHTRNNNNAYNASVTKGSQSIKKGNYQINLNRSVFNKDQRSS